MFVYALIDIKIVYAVTFWQCSLNSKYTFYTVFDIASYEFHTVTFGGHLINCTSIRITNVFFLSKEREVQI